MATATMPRVRIRHRLRPLALGTLAVCQFLLAANTVAAQRKFTACFMLTHPVCPLFNDGEIGPAVLPPISEVDPSSIRNATLFAPSPSSSCPPFLLPAPTPRPLPHLGTCHPSAQTPCCLPCPHFFTLYPPKATVALLHTTSFLRLISGLAAVFVFFSYLILPGKRTFPRVLVLYVSICVTMWHLAGLSGFDGQDGKTFFCSAEEGRGDVEGSEGTNNLKCAVQGLVLIYSGLGIAAWGLVMILNLHLVCTLFLPCSYPAYLVPFSDLRKTL
ncbi:hypothetical protein BC832DRAFT_460815 [Gaertneriomyces semiglobifer]|nr:hypothetical protein BC832DRAFT_460815 [Gaertneriomyces semiglobifer]